VLAQPALERDVVVLDRTTYKSTLVETGGQTGFFGGSEDVGAVQIGQHLVGNALESPRPVAHIFYHHNKSCIDVEFNYYSC